MGEVYDADQAPKQLSRAQQLTFPELVCKKIPATLGRLNLLPGPRLDSYPTPSESCLHRSQGQQGLPSLGLQDQQSQGSRVQDNRRP